MWLERIIIIIIINMMSKVLSGIQAADNPLSKWSAFDEDLQQQVAAIIRQRWEYFHSPILGAGYCLNPEFIKVCGENGECLDNLMDVIDTMLPDVADRQQARLQFASYQALEGVFSIGGRALEDAGHLPPHQWWEMYGKPKCPQLAFVAIRVLSQVRGREARHIAFHF